MNHMFAYCVVDRSISEEQRCRTLNHRTGGDVPSVQPVMRVKFGPVAPVPYPCRRENGLRPLHDMAVGNPGLSLHRRVVATREPGL